MMDRHVRDGALAGACVLALALVLGGCATGKSDPCLSCSLAQRCVAGVCIDGDAALFDGLPGVEDFKLPGEHDVTFDSGRDSDADAGGGANELGVADMARDSARCVAQKKTFTADATFVVPA
ncbi:MAG: hypothetical protein KC503_30435, partial [Myxococcales bacterium]|nr:hypothetical protein [Myxococcales bacterium]